MFEYILIGLGIVTVGSIGYLVLEKRINKYHHAA
jgi:preprotein translocase subunit Sss1